MSALKKIFYVVFGKFWITYYLNNFGNSLKNPKKYYHYCNYYFLHYLPASLKAHRIYFMQEQRAFGETPFVVMWYLLLKKYSFNNFLEIGIYRGQVISLFALYSKIFKKKISVSGISPMINANDSVTEYISIDYEKDIKSHYSFFNLEFSTLVKEYSNSQIAKDFIGSKMWDCIYIDGSHDYDIVKSDFENCYHSLKFGGILVFDDAAANLSGAQFFGEFSGHPGPSAVVDEIVSSKMVEFLRVGHNRCFKKV